jgi:hypothetical protein
MSELGPDRSNSIDRLAELKENTPSALSSAALEALLEQEKAQRNIERFFWVTVVTVMLSAILAKLVDSVVYTIFITLVSIAVIMGFAKWLEVPFILPYLERIFRRVSGTMQNVSEPSEEN